MAFLDFAFKVLELKDLERTGWKLRKVQKPESVAGHSFFLALLCLLYAKEEGLDTSKCVFLALVHDLHECICGDICSREFEHEQEMTNAEKKKVETRALNELLKIAPKEKIKELRAISMDYFNLSSREAQFVRDLDLVEMCLQALYYKKNKRTDQDLSDFFRKTSRELKTKTAKKLFKTIKKAL